MENELEPQQPKSEHQKVMEGRMYDIDAEIGKYIAEHNGDLPECIILNQRTIDEILTSYCDKDLLATLDWKEPVAFAFANGEVTLRIFRTVDVPYGHYFIR